MKNKTLILTTILAILVLLAGDVMIAILFDNRDVSLVATTLYSLIFVPVVYWLVDEWKKK